MKSLFRERSLHRPLRRLWAGGWDAAFTPRVLSLQVRPVQRQAHRDTGSLQPPLPSSQGLEPEAGVEWQPPANDLTTAPQVGLVPCPLLPVGPQHRHG